MSLMWTSHSTHFQWIFHSKGLLSTRKTADCAYWTCLCLPLPPEFRTNRAFRFRSYQIGVVHGGSGRFIPELPANLFPKTDWYKYSCYANSTNMFTKPHHEDIFPFIVQNAGVICGFSFIDVRKIQTMNARGQRVSPFSRDHRPELRNGFWISTLVRRDPFSSQSSRTKST